MARKRSAARNWIEYLAVRSAVFLLGALPLPLAASLGRGLMLLFHRFGARRRERVVEQVAAAYGGDLSRDEARRIVRGVYRHLGTMLAEVVRIPRLSLDNLDSVFDWGDSRQKIESALAEGKGLILASGHIGNWELLGAAFALVGYSVGAVARPLDNPLLDRLVRDIRGASGQQIWDKRGAMRRVVRILREGRSFGILVDQNAGASGVFVPFFGIPASTVPSTADLAFLRGSPIVTVACQRAGGPMRFVVRTGPVHRPDPEADRETERMRLLTLVNRDLEEIIRRAPEQWLWLHRRWKTRPPGEPAS